MLTPSAWICWPTALTTRAGHSRPPYQQLTQPPLVPAPAQDADPISLDLLATCYDDKSRPPPLTPRHISNYIARVEAGGPPVDKDPGTVSVPPSPLPGYGSRPLSGLPGGEPGSYGVGGGSMLEPLGASGGDAGGALVAPLEGPDSWDLFFEVGSPSHETSLGQLS